MQRNGSRKCTQVCVSVSVSVCACVSVCVSGTGRGGSRGAADCRARRGGREAQLDAHVTHAPHAPSRAPECLKQIDNKVRCRKTLRYSLQNLSPAPAPPPRRCSLLATRGRPRAAASVLVFLPKTIRLHSGGGTRSFYKCFLCFFLLTGFHVKQCRCFSRMFISVYSLILNVWAFIKRCMIL